MVKFRQNFRDLSVMKEEKFNDLKILMGVLLDMNPSIFQVGEYGKLFPVFFSWFPHLYGLSNPYLPYMVVSGLGA